MERKGKKSYLKARLGMERKGSEPDGKDWNLEQNRKTLSRTKRLGTERKGSYQKVAQRKGLEWFAT